MSSSTPYHQPNAPDSPDDSDSDLDIDLQELDPINSSSKATLSKSFQDRKDRSPSQPKTGRIALRNLRMGGSRAVGPNTRRYGNLGKSRTSDGESSAGLLYDASRNSGGSMDDDAPLLEAHNERRSRPSLDALHRISELGSRVRLPSFLSNTSGNQHPDDQYVEASDSASSRTVSVGAVQTSNFPPNIVSNAKYTPWSFLPVTLYNEFSFFFNMYFLLVALSQAIPALRIGYLSTYIVPLACVLAITLGKEAFDDIERRKRDTEANSEGYTALRFDAPGTGSRVRYHAR